MLFLAPLGPKCLNLWDHSPQNQSKASFSGYKPCVKILLISFYLFKSYYLETIRLRKTQTTTTYTNIRPKFLRLYKNILCIINGKYLIKYQFIIIYG